MAAIGSFLMIVGLAPFAGFWNESQSKNSDLNILSCPVAAFLLLPEPNVRGNQQDGDQSRHRYPEAGRG